MRVGATQCARIFGGPPYGNYYGKVNMLRSTRPFSLPRATAAGRGSDRECAGQARTQEMVGAGAHRVAVPLQHGAAQIVVQNDPRDAVLCSEGAEMTAQEIPHAGIEEKAQKYV